MKRPRRWPTLLFVACCLRVPIPALGSDSVFPGKQWTQASTESQQVDAKKLERAVEFLEKCGGSNGVKRLVIVRNGRMIWRGSEADVPQPVWSVSKSFTSTAHGLLIEDGKCTLDTPAKQYNPRDLAERYPNVTLRHLATMTSGYDGRGGAYDFAPGRRGDQNAWVRPLKPFFAPGEKFMYWDEATQQYGYVLERIAGQPLKKYLKQRILDPIGVTRFEWHHDRTGQVLNWTGGVVISAADLARFGLLFLNHGRWNGRQLVSPWWVDEATNVQVPATVPDALPTSDRQESGVYGFHWWVNGRRPDGKRFWPHAPQGTFCRSGYNNNDLFVIPAWNMVIVRLGLDQAENEITRDEYDQFLRLLGQAMKAPIVEGGRRAWLPVTIWFHGPKMRASDSDPNPFVDYRLQVEFTGPARQHYSVPGFFAGDGFGGQEGNVWKVRFAPDSAGRWTFRASFRRGNRVAVSLERDAGEPVAFDGATGAWKVGPRDEHAPGYLKWGRLQYAGNHYLKFRDGPYWVRGGTDSPENLLAYRGFDRTVPSHAYAAHVEDWRPGDPDWGDGRGRAIIGALNYLASKHVNSIYFLTMNVGGDGGDVWPWLGKVERKGSRDNDNLHYDISKLDQWNTVFDHAQRQGIFLHFVLNEAETANKRELDDGELGLERRLYYRELVARFGYHGALQWNLCEEFNHQFNLGPSRIRAFADYLRAVDPFDHPVTVHSAGDPLKALRFMFGDERFGILSIQLGQKEIGSLCEQLREATARAGRPLPVSMDEFTLDAGQRQGWIPVDNSNRWRIEKLWPTYFSGGNIEFILADLLKTDSFKTRELDRLWSYTWFARRFLEDLPFWKMAPADELVEGAATYTATRDRRRVKNRLGPQVLAKPGEVYAVYFPTAKKTGRIDLSAATKSLTLRWYNPRTGRFEGQDRTLEPQRATQLGPPPDSPEADWAALIR